MKQAIETYIKNLLLTNHRVIVPDLGAFIARTSAETSQENSLANKTIVFNDILKFNDGLLVNHIIQEEGTDINHVLDEVSAFANLVLTTLKEEKNYLIPEVGLLSRDKRGNIILEQNFSAITPDAESEKNSISENPIKSEEIPLTITEIHADTEIKEEEKKESVQASEIPSALNFQTDDKKETEQILEPELQNTTVVNTNAEIKETLPETEPEHQTPVDEKANKPKQKIKEEEALPPLIISDDVIKVEPKKEEKLPPPLPVEKKETEKISVAEKRRNEPDEIKKPEKKKEEKIVVAENKPIVKPTKKGKEEKNTESKKKTVLLPVIIWSVSGLFFLTLVFMAAVKFGFIKGVKIDPFSKDEWVSVNNKLSADLNEFNKKNRDKLKLPESESKQKGDNFGFSDGGSGGSEGSFDTPADNNNSFGSGEEVKTDESKSSEGSFDAPAENKQPEKELKKEKEKPAEKKKEEKTTKDIKPQKEEPKQQKSSTGRIVLVAGSFKEQKLAENFASQLQVKGFENASYIGKVNGLFMVAYATFDDQKTASAEYAKLQQKGVQTYLMKR